MPPNRLKKLAVTSFQRNLWQTLKPLGVDIFPLAIGEVVSKFAGFLLAVYLARHMGKEVFAIFALGQAAFQYTMAGTNLGVRYIAVRSVAKDTKLSSPIVNFATKRRLMLGFISVVFGICYGAFGPIPDDARWFVISFSMVALCHALSVDWIAWALRSFIHMAIWRALPPVAILLVTLAACRISDMHFGAIVTGGFLGHGLIIYLSWKFWKQHKNPNVQPSVTEIRRIKAEMSWKNITILGSAAVFVLLFTNLDIFMLAALSNKEELALYNSAYRILLLFFGFYFIFTQTMLPKMSKRGTLSSIARHGFFVKVLVALFLIGSLISFILYWFGRNLLIFVFGKPYSEAWPLLKLLLLCIPFEFLTSFLGTAFTASALYPYHSASLLIVVLSNFLLNLWLIPLYGAIGAAWTTFISYLLFIIIQLFILTYFLRWNVDRGQIFYNTSL